MPYIVPFRSILKYYYNCKKTKTKRFETRYITFKRNGMEYILALSTCRIYFAKVYIKNWIKSYHYIRALMQKCLWSYERYQSTNYDQFMTFKHNINIWSIQLMKMLVLPYKETMLFHFDEKFKLDEINSFLENLRDIYACAMTYKRYITPRNSPFLYNTIEI